jgi:hypothetical protein
MLSTGCRAGLLATGHRRDDAGERARFERRDEVKVPSLPGIMLGAKPEPPKTGRGRVKATAPGGTVISHR